MPLWKSESPLPLSPTSVVEVLAFGLGVRLVVDPSLPVAVGLVALAGPWALEKIFFSPRGVFPNSPIDGRRAAENACESGSKGEAAGGGLEGRLARLGTGGGGGTDVQGRR